PEDGPVQEQQRRQRLILRRRAHPPFHGKRREEARHFCHAHLVRVTLLVKHDVAPDPSHVGALGPASVVAAPERLTDRVEQPELTRDQAGSLAHVPRASVDACRLARHRPHGGREYRPRRSAETTLPRARNAGTFLPRRPLGGPSPDTGGDGADVPAATQHAVAPPSRGAPW